MKLSRTVLALAVALVVNVLLVILLTPLGFETRPATDLKTVGYIAIGTIFAALILDVASFALLFRSVRLASSLAIAGAVRDRNLWDAKISATQANVLEGRHIVCVYTSDFCNVADVRDAAIKLVKLGVVNERTIYYKPDVMTLGGVYSDTGAASIFGLRAETTFLFKTPGARTLDPRLHRLIDQGLEALAVLPRPPARRRQVRGRPHE